MMETNSQYQKFMLRIIKKNYYSNKWNQITMGCHQEDPKGSLHHSLWDRGLNQNVFINQLLNKNEIKLICINFN